MAAAGAVGVFLTPFLPTDMYCSDLVATDMVTVVVTSSRMVRGVAKCGILSRDRSPLLELVLSASLVGALMASNV